MAEYLAIEWDPVRMSVLSAVVSTGSVRVKQVVHLEPPEGWDNREAADAGAWLKAELVAKGLRSDRVLVALPRADVVMRRLELPDVSDEELPELVKFQTASKVSQPIDELCLDFLPTPRREGSPREVLAATIPREQAERIRSICAAAGLQVAVLGTSPVALSELVARSQPDAGDDQVGTLVVSRHGPRLEIFVSRRNVLIFSHATRLPEDYSTHEQQQATIGEISRALVAVKGVNASLKIQRGWLLVGSGDPAALISALKTRLGCEAQVLDPFALVAIDPQAHVPPDSSWFAGPLGLLLARSGARAAGIDFLSVRQPPVKKDPRRKQLTYGVSIAVAVVVLATGWYVWEYFRLSAQVAEKEQQNRELAAFIKQSEEVEKSAALVQAWEKQTVPWLDEFVELNRRLPPTDRMFVKSLKFDPQTGDAIGQISLTGYARDRKDVNGLIDSVVASGDRYHLLPQTSEPSGEDTYYPWKFTSNVLIDAPKKSKPKPAVASAAGTAKLDASKTEAAKTEPVKSDAPKAGAGKSEEAKQQPSERKTPASSPTTAKPAESPAGAKPAEKTAAPAGKPAESKVGVKS